MITDSLVKNAADETQVENAKEKELRGRELEINDFAWILSDRRGRRFLWRVFEFCGANSLSFSGENVNQTNFNEGMKNVSQKLLADTMETRPDAYIEMIQENKKDKTNGR